MATAATRDFLVGNVIGQGFRLFFRNIVPFGLISLILFIPYIILIIYTARTGVPQEGSGIDIVTRILQLLLSFVVAGAIAFGTFRDMRGQQASTSECLSRGLATMLPILGVAIVTGVAVLIGLIALIVPGLFILTVLWVAVPAAVVERPGVFEALSRSAVLTEGYRWRVFGVIVLLLLINMGVGLIVGLIASVLILAGGGLGSSGGVIALFVVLGIFDALLSAFSAVVTAVGYHDLRAAKEGISIDDIAKVFD